MSNIKTAKTLSIWAIITITVIFLVIISPLRWLKLFAFPIIMLGIGLWVASLFSLISGLMKRKKEPFKKSTLIIATLLVIGFIPIGYTYFGLRWYFRSKITIDIVNISSFDLDNVSNYGDGDIFEGTDSLKIRKLKMGQDTQFIIRASTKPPRKGYVKMEYDFKGKHTKKNIAGEFITYQSIKQDWEVVIDQVFLEDENND